MPSVTVENYLKQAYLAQHGHDHGRSRDDTRVPMGRLAAGVGVTPGTATTMVKALADAGLLDYEPRGGFSLTPAGEKLALEVLRRHRLIELFLVQTLGLDWSEVHEEAEELEHAISEKVLERIDALLGHPEVDPHGDPIPPRHGGPPPRHDLPNLTDCPTGQRLRIARVLDQAGSFLQFLDTHGLTPGAEITVAPRHPSADAVTVTPTETGLGPITLGTAAAAKILVSVEAVD